MESLARGTHSEQHTQEEWATIAGRALEEAVVVEALQDSTNIMSLEDSLSILLSRTTSPWELGGNSN